MTVRKINERVMDDYNDDQCVEVFLRKQGIEHDDICAFRDCNHCHHYYTLRAKGHDVPKPPRTGCVYDIPEELEKAKDAIRKHITKDDTRIYVYLNDERYLVTDILNANGLFTVTINADKQDTLKQDLRNKDLDLSTEQLSRGYDNIMKKTNDIDFNVPLKWFDDVTLFFDNLTYDPLGEGDNG